MPRYDNLEKNISRSFAFGRTAGYWKRALLMPSSGILDVIHGHNRGWFHKNHTQIDAVEDNSYGKDYYVQMCDNLKLSGYHNVTPHRRTMNDMVLFDSYDLMWLDYCGEISHASTCWMQQMAVPHIAPGGTLAITMSFGIRGTPSKHMILHETVELVSNQWNEEYKQFCAGHPLVQQFVNADKRIMIPLFLIERNVLRGYNFEPAKAYRYRDTFPMVVFRWNNIRPLLTEEIPTNMSPETIEVESFNNIPETERKSLMPVAKKKSSVRSQAAFKANITRQKFANQARYEAGEISKGTLRSLNANVTIRARRNGYLG